MKEYSEIYIDPEESLQSFLEKVQEVDDQKLVIIIHQRSSIFIGQVNIELMKKYAQRANKKLIFITNIKKIKNLLVGVGFEVYDDLEIFKKDKKLIETNQNPVVSKDNNALKIKSKSSKLTIIIMCLLICASIGAGVFYFNLPAITVKVTPVLKNKQVLSNLKAEIDTDKLDYVNQKLPLLKKELKLKSTVEVKATGEKSVGVKYAKGVVTFINNNKEKVIIPAGTIITTRNGIKYKTVAKAVVPQLKVEKMMGVVVGAQAGKEEVDIRALYKGEKANVSSGRIVNLVKGSYPVKLVNPEATSGGENRLLSQITKEDLKRGLKKAKHNLDQRVTEDLGKKFGKEMIFFSNQVRLSEPKLQPKSKSGELSRKLVVEGEIEAVGFAIKKKDLKNLVFKLYNNQLGNEFKLYSDKIKIKEIKVSKVAEKYLELQAISSGKVIGNLNQVELIDKILGKKVANVKSLLDNMNEVSNYSINPKNQINLPKFKYGVKLVVIEPPKE